MVFFEADDRYRRFLAAHPGVWDEVGASDDPHFVAVLLEERESLGLPSLVNSAPRRPARRRVRG